MCRHWVKSGRMGRGSDLETLKVRRLQGREACKVRERVVSGPRERRFDHVMRDLLGGGSRAFLYLAESRYLVGEGWYLVRGRWRRWGSAVHRHHRPQSRHLEMEVFLRLAN